MTEPKIAIIMPSFLGWYQGGATNKIEKFKRAVDSVLNQTYTNWILIIVADGCEDTIKEYQRFFKNHPQIACKLIPKQENFSGIVRQTGLDIIDTIDDVDIVCYLDSDDYFGINHLQKISEQFDLEKYDFVIWDDFHWKHERDWQRRNVTLQVGNIGTDSIAHKPRLTKVKWKTNEFYTGDGVFITDLLREYPRYIKITDCEYYLCHQPNIYDI